MREDLAPIWVDTADGVHDVAAAIAAEGRLALDTEADSLHSYFHKVCLVQVTTDGCHFVVDPLALDPEELRPLWKIVEDPGVPVLMHGADYDLRVLDRDYQVRIRGLVDTQTMAQILGEPKTGLAALLHNELGIELDKRHQRADWGRRPLTGSQVAYAAADTAHLGDLAERLQARLEELGRWDWAVEDFRRLEQVRHNSVEPDPIAFERVKGVRALRGADRDRAFTLFEWRESEAQRLDTPPFKVLGNKTLVALAEIAPKAVPPLAEVDGIGFRFVRRWGRQVLRLLGNPDPAPKREKHRRTQDAPVPVVRRVKKLIAARDEAIAEFGIEPGLVCPRACALAVASHEPRCTTVADLEAAGLTGWRLELLGDVFLAVLKDD